MREEAPTTALKLAAPLLPFSLLFLAMPRTPEQFVRARRDAWERLEELVERAQGARLGALSNDELHELGTLYRRTSADLARAQTRYNATLAGQELVRTLNALVRRAHAQIYSSPASSHAAPQNAWNWLFYGFPAAFRRHWRAIAFAALLMYGPAVASYVAVWSDSANTRLFLDQEVVKTVEDRAQKKLVTGWGGNTSYKGVVESPEISGFIMTNNIRVSIMAVALGVTAGLGTALVLISNGMMIGSLAAVASNNNVDYLFWSVILPHGILELSAIAIAGGAGFVLARAIFAPGDLPRRDALKIAGGEAAQLLVGVAAMLVVAGLIEGFITPADISPDFKMGFAALTGLAMAAYLFVKPRAKTAQLLTN